MTNKEIAGAFDLLAKLMELHSDNPFKIKSYQSAYINLRKFDKPLTSMSKEELIELKGVGDAIADKIQSLAQTGKMPTLEKYIAKTPPGVVEMLQINGLGPKKVATLWKDYGFTSPGELLYACNENRLVELKGFGEKSQESISKNIGFLQSSAGKYLHSRVRNHAETIIAQLKKSFPNDRTEITGELRRGVQEIAQLELLTTIGKEELKSIFTEESFIWNESAYNNHTTGIYNEFLPVAFIHSTVDEFIQNWFITTGPSEFITKYTIDKHAQSEEILFTQNGLTYLSPELRDILPGTIDQKSVDKLIELKDIKGIIHAHSTYSDGIHSLSEMAESVAKASFNYLVITDHSKSSALANGLKENQLIEQWQEIDNLNKKYDTFRILKGIECDILANGDLDYPDEILSQFDLVIASIHIAFQMDEDKATQRMIKVIENKYCNIIGHPSGRLILTREGYPLNYSKIIDACKANQVAIELNANPQRLDIDYKWIGACIDKGVQIAINPDAHNKTSIADINYGITAARKGLLPKELCLNTYMTDQLLDFCKKK